MDDIVWAMSTDFVKLNASYRVAEVFVAFKDGKYYNYNIKMSSQDGIRVDYYGIFCFGIQDTLYEDYSVEVINDYGGNYQSLPIY